MSGTLSYNIEEARGEIKKDPTRLPILIKKYTGLVEKVCRDPSAAFSDAEDQKQETIEYYLGEASNFEKESSKPGITSEEQEAYKSEAVEYRQQSQFEGKKAYLISLIEALATSKGIKKILKENNVSTQ